MASRTIYIVGLVTVIVALGVVALGFAVDTVPTDIPIAMIALAAIIYIWGSFVEMGEKKRAKIEARRRDREALARFFDLLDFDQNVNIEMPWQARLVGDLYIEVSVNGSWDGKTNKYFLSELDKEVLNGHTFYYKTGVMGFFFYHETKETVLVYFA